ncbi:hypothetical protein PCK1_000668 [Pneumocystis canis]|nr:hypothetical protein PCK1_000668 [Pneumocystis canis]
MILTALINSFFPAQNLVLLQLNHHQDIQQIVLGSDIDCGGRSTAELILNEEQFCGRFYGEIVKNSKEMMYAAFRTKKKRLLFKTSWDLSPYKYISLYGMGDTRTYFINLQTTSFLMPDLYQTSFTFKNPKKWEIIPLNAFRLKRKGPGLSNYRFSGIERIQTIGISLLDQEPGPFELYLSWIYATNEIHPTIGFFDSSKCKSILSTPGISE